MERLCVAGVSGVFGFVLFGFWKGVGPTMFKFREVPEVPFTLPEKKLIIDFHILSLVLSLLLRSDDHHPLLHRHSEDGGWRLSQGLARRPCGVLQHHPLLYGGRQSGGRSLAKHQGQVDRRGKLAGLFYFWYEGDQSLIECFLDLL